MNLEEIRKERQKWLLWKNITPFQEAINKLPNSPKTFVNLGDVIGVSSSFNREGKEHIKETALLMKPWRKGPFQIGSLFIDAEWKSYLKYNLLEPHFNLENKIVGDIGCNNGYYLFKMQSQNPKRLVGFDPSAIYYSQFLFLNHFFKSNIKYELLGVEHIPFYEHKFDVLFCLGVLYHRSDPISSLKAIFNGLNKKGELFLDTFIIDGDDEVCLFPKDRYSKMRNIYFIPTINALKNWCYRAGFSKVEIISIVKTTSNEQRDTPWVGTQSLEDYLDSNDENKTVEGYPSPKRAYLKVFKGN